MLAILAGCATALAAASGAPSYPSPNSLGGKTNDASPNAFGDGDDARAGPTEPLPPELAAVPLNARVWLSESDGSIRHVQSGLICPAKIGVVTRRWAFDSPFPRGRGTYASCDYGRGGAGAIGLYQISKLMISVERSAPGTTLDAAFEGYRWEMSRSFPGAHNPAPIILTESSRPVDQPLPEARSEGNDIELEGRAYRTELVVAIVSGWVIKITSIYPTGSTDPYANTSADASGSLAALILAASSIGRSI